MVLTRKTEEADDVKRVFNILHNQSCDTYYGNANKPALDRFRNGQVRVLVVCGKLLEGFDRAHVSVVAILRNIGSASKVLFTQFVGRAVRRLPGEPAITAAVISHVCHNQRANFDHLEDLADEEPDEEND